MDVDSALLIDAALADIAGELLDFTHYRADLLAQGLINNNSTDVPAPKFVPVYSAKVASNSVRCLYVFLVFALYLRDTTLGFESICSKQS
jgi:hypothetical protein